MAIFHCLNGSGGIAREADSDQNILRRNPNNLLKYLAVGSGGNQANVVKHIVKKIA